MRRVIWTVFRRGSHLPGNTLPAAEPNHVARELSRLCSARQVSVIAGARQLTRSNQENGGARCFSSLQVPMRLHRVL